jgi:acyl dehydratase
MGLEPIVTRHSYTARDTMLYALGVGAGMNAPTAPSELRLVYEDGLVALPTMAVTLAYPGFWLKDPQYGLDWKRLLHGEQSVVIHSPLPVAADVVGTTRIDAIFDKGADKGAIIYSSREISDASAGTLLATVGQAAFLRGDGGFGGSGHGAPRPNPIPDRAPDEVKVLPTRTDQALLYRLSGDYNPLHADPVIAKEAGFAVPILHGLCTYGVAGRGAATLLCGGDPNRIKRFDVRFSAPVFPGETLEVAVWRDAQGEGSAALRARVVERDLVVLQNGLVEFV